MIRIEVKIFHRAPHAWLECLFLMFKEPHHCTPREGRKDREEWCLWRDWTVLAVWLSRSWRRRSSRNERRNDTGGHVKYDLNLIGRQCEEGWNSRLKITCSLMAVRSPKTTYPPMRPAMNVSAERSLPSFSLRCNNTSDLYIVTNFARFTACVFVALKICVPRALMLRRVGEERRVVENDEECTYSPFPKRMLMIRAWGKRILTP